ncbi:death-associated protein kinase dapk-1-like [Amphiura filiformis]|uniref:death-associated protein kinase dapk-1-like n=1 Tax=Amphiura filiformis TaxID=82378 RepID=UPI003B21217D
MTPGINVVKTKVQGAGEFLIWDLAGQVEYAITHGMFLGVDQCLFVVVYDLVELSNGDQSTTEYWLPFLKAARKSEDKTQVVLVGSHLDRIHNKPEGEKAAEFLLRQSKKMFDGLLDIEDSVIVVDARDERCKGVETLKKVLKERRECIVGTKKLPKVCDKMEKIIKPWREEDVPVISWQEYSDRVRKKYPGMDESELRTVTSYLHLMGEVYLAEFDEHDDQVILNTNWFMTNIIGAAFAGKEFAKQQVHLPDQPYYTLEELRAFFMKKIDTPRLLAILDLMGLVHETEDQKYLLPGKLPSEGSEVEWDPQRDDVKGISIECASETDIFNPNLYPSVQKKILDANRRSSAVSRSTVKYARGSVTVLVRLTKHKRSINIAAKCPDKDSVGACYESLHEASDLIQSEIFDRSPGTDLNVNYISHESLQTSTNLEDVLTYSKDSLMQAEKDDDGFVARLRNPADVTTKILFPGYDKMFLQEFGVDCRYEWLPMDTITRCFRIMDGDYRAVGKALRIESDVINDIAEDSKRHKESPTDNIIKRWCKKNKRKMTIGMLQKLLSRPSLAANEDALRAVEEVIQALEAKHSEDGSSIEAFEPEVVRDTSGSRNDDTNDAPGKGGHVMISYNWGSQERMKRLKDELEHDGFSIWMDVEEMSK